MTLRSANVAWAALVVLVSSQQTKRTAKHVNAAMLLLVCAGSICCSPARAYNMPPWGCSRGHSPCVGQLAVVGVGVMVCTCCHVLWCGCDGVWVSCFLPAPMLLHPCPLVLPRVESVSTLMSRHASCVHSLKVSELVVCIAYTVLQRVSRCICCYNPPAAASKQGGVTQGWLRSIPVVVPVCPHARAWHVEINQGGGTGWGVCPSAPLRVIARIATPENGPSGALLQSVSVWPCSSFPSAACRPLLGQRLPFAAS